MDKLKEIRSLEDLKDFVLLNKDSIKKAALPITVAVALLIFWLSGLSSNSEIDNDESITQNSTIQYEYDKEYDDSDNTKDGSGESGTGTNNNANSSKQQIYVDIGGCVKNPGVYKLTEGTRLFQLISQAGGLTDDADTDSINQAEEVYDGQKIMIYSVNDNSNSENGSYGSSGNGQNSSQFSAGKININRADASALQEIPGVGPATAQKIIEYRENSGRFNSIEDIKNVSGIGDKTFENMKEYITV